MESAAAPRSYSFDRQMQIYQSGMTGGKPAAPVDLAKLERKAKETLTAEAYDYVAGGAGGEDTMRANNAVPLGMSLLVPGAVCKRLVRRHTEVGHGDPLGRVTDIWVLAKPSYQDDFVD